MSKTEANILRISRLLTPEHRGNLLAFIHLAHVAETSIRKPFGVEPSPNGTFTRKTQEYSCKNNVQRSKK